MSAPKEQKKGEVNELLTLLRGVNSSKEAPSTLTKKKREVLKKVSLLPNHLLYAAPDSSSPLPAPRSPYSQPYRNTGNRLYDSWN